MELAVPLLFVNAVFNIAVWPMFLRRVAKDPRARDAAGRPTAFLRVHVILVSIALAIALAIAAASVIVAVIALVSA